MIRISSFDIMNNFAREIFEFSDEKILFKIKSLTVECEREIKYEKIKSIIHFKRVDLRWFWRGFFIIAIMSGLMFIRVLTHLNNPTINLIQRSGVVVGLILCIPAFHKNDYCSFVDEDKKYLFGIRIDSEITRELLIMAIERIKQKTEIISDADPTNPLVDQPPVFEITQYDIPDFLHRSTSRFYEDRIIDHEKSLEMEMVTEVKYSELSGKIQSIKSGNNNWSTLWLSWFMFICFLTIFIFSFFPLPGKFYLFFSYLLSGTVILLIPLHFLQYIKREFLIFNNKNDQSIYWVTRNSANRKKLDEIVAFIQNKVTPGTMDQ
jgi:hypothetical protein